MRLKNEPGPFLHITQHSPINGLCFIPKRDKTFGETVNDYRQVLVRMKLRLASPCMINETIRPNQFDVLSSIRLEAFPQDGIALLLNLLLDS